ncbi:unnamed protein product [Choristocarpus tenellus]
MVKLTFAKRAAMPAIEVAVPIMPESMKQGIYVTLAYVSLFYLFILGQQVAKWQLKAYYHSKGKRMLRYYNSTESKMLGWDRTVGNMLEQAMPFLTLFWVNIALDIINSSSSGTVITAGWCYVAFRFLYPVFWFNGGGGRSGGSSKMLFCTGPMYAVIAFLAWEACVNCHVKDT